jgi:large subunit ribosomal protein L27Ae
MRYFHKTQNKFHEPTINLDKIWTLVTDQMRHKYAAQKAKMPVIDVTNAVHIYPFLSS